MAVRITSNGVSFTIGIVGQDVGPFDVGEATIYSDIDLVTLGDGEAFGTITGTSTASFFAAIGAAGSATIAGAGAVSAIAATGSASSATISGSSSLVAVGAADSSSAATIAGTSTVIGVADNSGAASGAFSNAFSSAFDVGQSEETPSFSNAFSIAFDVAA